MTRYKAGQIASVVNAVSIVSAVGVLFPGLFGWTAVMNAFSVVGILCFLVGLCLLLRYQNVFAAAPKKELEKMGLSAQYESVLMPLLLPGGCASLHMIKNANPESWWELVIAAVILCVALGVLFWLLAPDLHSKPGELIALAVLLAFFQAGNIWQANVLLDWQEPEYAQVEVMDKDSSHSSKGGYTYYFVSELDSEERRFHVSASHWSSLSEGDTVTIAIHSGGLGMEYYVPEWP